MSFKGFLISRAFLLNLVIAIVLTGIILFSVTFALRIYTRHGEAFAVPDLSGQTLPQARRILEAKHLNYQVVDSLFVNDQKPGAILEQVPVSGFLVKQGRTVFLTVRSQNPEKIPMPKLTDISYRQAVNIIQSMGLIVGNVSYVPSEYPDLVLVIKANGQDIPVGQEISKGSSIDLTIGKSAGGARTVVPDLIGIPLQQAEQELSNLYLTTGAVIYDKTVADASDSVNAFIWQQHPGPSQNETKVEQGTAVDLWLTTDKTRLGKDSLMIIGN